MAGCTSRELAQKQAALPEEAHADTAHARGLLPTRTAGEPARRPQAGPWLSWAVVCVKLEEDRNAVGGPFCVGIAPDELSQARWSGGWAERAPRQKRHSSQQLQSRPAGRNPPAALCFHPLHTQTSGSNPSPGLSGCQAEPRNTCVNFLSKSPSCPSFGPSTVTGRTEGLPTASGPPRNAHRHAEAAGAEDQGFCSKIPLCRLLGHRESCACPRHSPVQVSKAAPEARHAPEGCFLTACPL